MKVHKNDHNHNLICFILVGITLLTVAPLAAQTSTQQDEPAIDQQEILDNLPKIADEPRAIDPSKLLPPKLAQKATQDFSDSSLREVVAWLQEEQGIIVLLDKSSLSEINISPAEPVSDRLDDDPIYLLLNRLKLMGLGWYFDDDVLYITSVEMAENRATTLPYNVGDLIDSGYDLERLVSVITVTIAPDSWEDSGGIGALNTLGDVLFVRQADEQQRGVNALIQALRKHSRQTFLNDPPQNRELRERLIEAIIAQADPESWSDQGGVGEVDSAKPGTLVVTHQEQVHQEVLHLLETYRTALRSSKIRNLGEEENEVVTVYYRLHTNVAKDLSEMLPTLVRADTWSSEENDDKPGKVFVVSSEPDFSRTGGKGVEPVAVERSVMIIRQTRAAHKEIAKVISRVRTGDAPVGGLGGGGFGGGFFAIPPVQPAPTRSGAKQ